MTLVVMNSKPTQSIKNSQVIIESGTCPLTLFGFRPDGIELSALDGHREVCVLYGQEFHNFEILVVFSFFWWQQIIRGLF